MTVPPDDRAREDELFRQIVAGYGEGATDPVPPWPVAEDADAPAPEASALGASAPEDVPAPTAPPVRREEPGLPDWVEPEALPDNEHFVPPEPPRLPRPRLRTATGLVVLLLGLAALLVPYQIGLDDSTGSLLLAMMVTGTGLYLLITSLGDSRDDPDDGAIV